uniref:Uncharacterized protein n=1 Tax=Rhizophora mucronata TaxID=61149 RepID=A0A2P2J0F2_RHIMU
MTIVTYHLKTMAAALTMSHLFLNCTPYCYIQQFKDRLFAFAC